MEVETLISTAFFAYSAVGAIVLALLLAIVPPDALLHGGLGRTSVACSILHCRTVRNVPPGSTDVAACARLSTSTRSRPSPHVLNRQKHRARDYGDLGSWSRTVGSYTRRCGYSAWAGGACALYPFARCNGPHLAVLRLDIVEPDPAEFWVLRVTSCRCRRVWRRQLGHRACSRPGGGHSIRGALLSSNDGDCSLRNCSDSVDANYHVELCSVGARLSQQAASLSDATCGILRCGGTVALSIAGPSIISCGQVPASFQEWRLSIGNSRYCRYR